ncbi:16S rRNA (uracil(1498)-N(3))-methyltransferase [uncultured Psychrobacter sp.]|uniref:16S rRNA (uracil(1498)-N(3))-methyltransferase n=1 Tax=uncultured Psychrobacter sp. TaxID=259303 RepID=UPI00345873C3
MRRFFYAVNSQIDSNDDALERLALHKLSIGSSIDLTTSIAHHWCRVLRANIGDCGLLFDGFGGEYQVQLQTIGKKHATAVLLAHDSDDRTPSIRTKIGLVMSRGERMDYAIQKATELGVTAIQLLSSHHGEVNLKPAQIDKKLLHWQQVALSACEQCGLNRPPLILSPLSIEAWLQQEVSESIEPNKAINSIVAPLSFDPYYQILNMQADLRIQMNVPAADQPIRPKMLTEVLAQDNPYIELLIGPEGGLSHDERQLAENYGFLAWQIGNRVLRTETAPVVALATLYALGDG